MLWLIRKLLKLIIFLCIISILVVAAVVLFVDPSHFKKEINTYLQSHSGYMVEIRGPISWSFKPQATLSCGDVVLVGPAGFKSPFMEAKEVLINLDPYSLLNDNLVITKLEVTGLVAVVEQQASGVKNIDSIKPTASSSTNKITIQKLIIKNSTLMYQDDHNTQHWALNNAYVETNNLTLNPIGKLGAIIAKGDLNNLDHNISANVDTVVNYDPTNNSVTLDPTTVTWGQAKLTGNTVITATKDKTSIAGAMKLDALNLAALIMAIKPELINSDNKITSKLEGDATFSYILQGKVLELSSFSFKLDDGTLNGNLKIGFVSPHIASFDITATKVNFEPLLATANNILPINSDITNITSHVAFIKSVNLTGKFSGSELHLGTNLAIDHVTADISVTNGMINLNPVTLSALDSNHNFSLAVDLSNDLPTVKLTEQAQNVAIAPLLSFLNDPNIVTGSVDAKIALDATGNDLISLEKSATGSFNMIIKNGALFGVNIDYLLQYTASSVNGVFAQLASSKSSDPTALIKAKAAAWRSTPKDNLATKFDTFELKTDFKQGFGTTNLTMSSPNFDLKGSGNFNLADHKINCTVFITNRATKMTTIAYANDAIAQAQIPLTVSGTIDKMVFTPDIQNFLVLIVQGTQNAILKKAATTMVAATGPSSLTSKAAEDVFVDSIKVLGK